MKNILVTGGAGYIGSKVSYELKDRGYNVIIVDNLSTGNKKQIGSNFTFYKVDLKKLNNLIKIIKKYKIHAIFHFAGLTNVKDSEKNKKKYYVNNVLTTVNILKLLKIFSIKYFIFSSSASVYGNQKNICVKESSNKNPQSNYGKNKLTCENRIKLFSKKYKFNYAILRYFNVVGPDKKMRCGPLHNGSLFSNISKAIKSKKKINIYGDNYNTKDGTAIRDYIDVNDLSELHILSLHKIMRKSLVLNCGYNKGYSVLNVINTFNKLLKNKIKYLIKKPRPEDIEKIYANTELLRKNFPKWKRKYSLIKTIKNIIVWERFKIKK